jgi:hypothetical protein
MYAVTIEPLNAIVFLAVPPGDGPWSVVEGVELDLPSNYDARPEGAPPPEQLVCRSASDPKVFKVFNDSRDVPPAEFHSTGKTFGGFFSERTWRRFREKLAGHMKFLEIPDDDPPGAFDEAMRLIREAR